MSTNSSRLVTDTRSISCETPTDRIPTVQIQSDRLGAIDVDPTSVIEFTDGLLGFEDHKRFVLISADESGAYCWMQSLDNSALAFLAVVPGFFFDDYVPNVPEADVDALGLTEATATQVLCLVTLSDAGITANLLGPIVVNLDSRQARQSVLTDGHWTTRESLGTRECSS
jgi:flagellar assembly factor FliW